MTSSSVGRALTRRKKSMEISAPMPHREGQFKFASGTIKRSKISAPVDLLSSTNLIAYTAPDLPSHETPSSSKSKSKSASASSSTSSFRSGAGDDSDMASSTRGSSSTTPVTTPDTQSQDTSPVSTGPSKQQEQEYFGASRRSHTNSSSTRSRTSTSSSTGHVNPNITPELPQRSLSHTKQSHQDLARQRSRSKMNPPPTSISSTHASRITHQRQQKQQQPRRHPSQTAEPSQHPFGKELEQVNEVAEEFSSSMSNEQRQEEEMLLSKGYRKFSVQDYLLEIHDLYRTIFDDDVCQPSQVWI